DLITDIRQKEESLNDAKDYGDVQATESDGDLITDIRQKEESLNDAKDYGDIQTTESDGDLITDIRQKEESLNEAQEYGHIQVSESGDDHVVDIRQTAGAIVAAEEAIREHERNRAEFIEEIIEELPEKESSVTRDKKNTDIELLEDTFTVHPVTFKASKLLEGITDEELKNQKIIDITIDTEGDSIIVIGHDDEDDDTYTFIPDPDDPFEEGDIPLILTVTDGDKTTTLKTSFKLPVEEEFVNSIVEISDMTEFVMDEDGKIQITEDELLANAFDSDGDVLTIEDLAVDDGVLVDNGDGTWTFTPDENFHGEISLSYMVNDGSEAVKASGVVTVVSVNDAPIIDAVDEGTVDEGASLISGQLTSSDVDDNATATFTISKGSEAPSGFVLNENGSYSFDPADTAYDRLNVGDSTLLTIPVTVTDDYGATDTTQIQITVIGTNDAPVVEDLTKTLDEGSAAISGQLISIDSDAAATAAFTITEGVDAPAGFVLDEEGNYSFDPA
ncbi:MAG: cadherin-like domain-containing protein, partial [Sedimenticola sp.]